MAAKNHDKKNTHGGHGGNDWDEQWQGQLEHNVINYHYIGMYETGPGGYRSLANQHTPSLNKYTIRPDSYLAKY